MSKIAQLQAAITILDDAIDHVDQSAESGVAATIADIAGLAIGELVAEVHVNKLARNVKSALIRAYDEDVDATPGISAALMTARKPINLALNALTSALAK